MYSDLLESSSKDSYLFNDQSSSYDMAEVNEINNQTNLDYIFDSYCSSVSVSPYNTGFDLPEDCKNMSFSELFDQELFSTHENKDCKLTIKIEKEEPLNSCYSANNLQGTTDSSENLLENISSSTSSKSFAPKRGINRTYIKPTKNCDVERLIQSPFYEPANLDDQLMIKVRKPTIKCEPVDLNETVEQNIVESDKISCFNNDFQNTLIDSHTLIKIEENIQSSSSKNTATNYSAINNISVKNSSNDGFKNFTDNTVCESDDLFIDQSLIKIETPFIKQEPEEANDIIEEDIDVEFNPYSFIINDSQKQMSDDLSLVKFNDDIKYSLMKSSPETLTKLPVTNKTSVKPTKNCDIKNVMSNNFPASKRQGVDQKLIKIKTITVKPEPEESNDIFEQEYINMNKNLYFTGDSQSQVKNYNSLKITENYDTKNSKSNNLSEIKNLRFDQMPVKIRTPIIKCEPEDINDIIEHDIEMEMNQCFSNDGCGDEIENSNDVNIQNNFSSSGFTSQHQSFNHVSLKNTENNCVKHLIPNSFYESNELVNNQMIAKVQLPAIKHENIDVNDIFNQNSVGMEIHLEEDNLISEETSKYTGLEDFCCNNLNCTKIESPKIVIKKEAIDSNDITSIKNDNIETTKNGISLETEKKKISWEEYKAKIGKIISSKISENHNEPVSDIAASKNDELETIKEEFDRNTAEYFVGQKRKIKDKKEQKVNEIKMSYEDQELQNKRMKIEYIKKILPTSFASEIAKTSSLMKGNNYADDIENESNSDDSIMSSGKTQKKKSDTYFKKDDKCQKKYYQTRVHSSYRNSSRSDYCNKSNRLCSSSSSSNPDEYYNRNRVDASQNGQYNQNLQNTVQRSRDQKRVVYVGQIPIKFGKRYLYNRFKMFGSIQSLTLHKKPDFRVYYAFVTYSEKSEAERAINHGNDDETQVQLDIRFGERKQTQTPYYDLDDEWLTDWYGYNQLPVPVVKPHSPEKTSFEEELQEFYKLAKIKKSNKIKSSQIS